MAEGGFAPVNMGIRELAEFLYSTGSIDSRFTGTDAALMGTILHRRLQKQAGPGYTAETPIKETARYKDMTLVLTGRVDGLLQEDAALYGLQSDQPTEVVDEIKTTDADLAGITEQISAPHWAQATLYASILCSQNSLPGMGVRLTYCNTDSGQILYRRKHFTGEQLQAFFNQMLADYYPWAVLRADWTERRQHGLSLLTFPFDSYREGQRRLCTAVYRTVQRQKRLFACAPTGTGKTLATLFPAMKAVGAGCGDKIFYFTAKTITRQSVSDCVALLKEAYHSRFGQPLAFRTLVLTAKDKLCPQPERNCTPQSCPYAAGYYDRVRDAVYQILQQNKELDRPAIESYAQAYRLCPYELSLDLSLWCDCIICDYNYLFDPTVYLRRFFDAKNTDHIFLIDEAHNLVDRSREMYSADLTQAEFSALKKLLPKTERSLRKSCTEAEKAFKAVFDAAIEDLSALPPGEYAGENALTVHNCPLQSPAQPNVSRETDIGAKDSAPAQNDALFPQTEKNAAKPTQLLQAGEPFAALPVDAASATPALQPQVLPSLPESSSSTEHIAKALPLQPAKAAQTVLLSPQESQPNVSRETGTDTTEPLLPPAISLPALQEEPTTDERPSICPPAPATALEQCKLFTAQIAKWVKAAEKWLNAHKASEQEAAVLQLYFRTKFFLRIAQQAGENYVTLLQPLRKSTRKPAHSIKLFCTDASAYLNERMTKGRASVLFSATLQPMEYYKQVLGCTQDTSTVILQSPFPKQNLQVTVDPTSTKYNDRKETCEKICTLLYDFFLRCGGNCFAFFPSFAYLQMVQQSFTQLYPQVEQLVQTTAMTEEDRELFLARFTPENRILAFCVLGGIFSEGVDLPGKRLVGAVIVGVGLPQIGPEPDAIRRYFDSKDGMGFAYAYQYPGMNKVLQSAGRVIRTETDTGQVLLIDSRFKTRSYASLLPEHLQPNSKKPAT